MKTLEELIAPLREEALKSWSGKGGEERAETLEKFLHETLDNYSAKLGFTKVELLSAMEKRRNYSAINYYQRANFPLLDENVFLYVNREAYLKECPSKEFVCPRCGGISTDPEVCNSGKEMEKGKICDWKSFGLFGTMGKGASIIFRETFLEDGGVYKIFMPKELAK